MAIADLFGQNCQVGQYKLILHPIWYANLLPARKDVLIIIPASSCMNHHMSFGISYYLDTNCQILNLQQPSLVVDKSGCIWARMYVCLYVCMSVCLYVCMSVCLSVCLSVERSFGVCRSVGLLVGWSIRWLVGRLVGRSVSESVCMYIYMHKKAPIIIW